jgi:hypothetical protein
MTRKLLPSLWLCLAPLLLVGCSSEPPLTPEQKEVKEAFVSLQKALEARDADKIWALLDADSQADAERQADAVRKAYAKADKAARKEMEEESYGLPGKDLESLTGAGFLKTRRFLSGKTGEIHDSKFLKVTVKGNKATVTYLEEDGDEEKLTFNKEKGGWKASLEMRSGS